MHEEDQVTALARALCAADGDDPDRWVSTVHRPPGMVAAVVRQYQRLWETRRGHAGKVLDALRTVGVALERVP